MLSSVPRGECAEMNDNDLDFSVQMQRLQRSEQEYKCEMAKHDMERAKFDADRAKRELVWKRKSEIYTRRMRVYERRANRLSRVASIVFMVSLAVACFLWLSPLSSLLQRFK